MSSDISKPGRSGLEPKGAKGNFAAVVPKTKGGSGLRSKSQQQAERAASRIELAFVFDATGSRSATWATAQVTQSEMIETYASQGSNVEVGIVTFGGGSVSLLGWFQDAKEARRKMGSVSCVVGGTQIQRSFERCIQGDRKPTAIVLVGDCFEEKEQDILAACGRLKVMNTPVLAFHEGNDQKGEAAFRVIAEATGGVFQKFGPNLPLRDLIRPFFVYQTRGRDAFNRLVQTGDKGAQSLVKGGLLALPAPDDSF